MVQCFVMSENLADEAQENLLAKAEALQPSQVEPEREPVRIVIIGSLEGVNKIVVTLHHLGFAEVNRWSRPIPTGKPGEVMRILIKKLLIENNHNKP